jgi:hypothetical protein
MVGQTFGRLSVLKAMPVNGKKRRYECSCACGNPNTIIVSGTNLRSGHTQSCGCIRIENTKQMDRDRTEDFTGRRIGNVIVLERDENKIHPNGGSSVMWRCKCDCGKIFTTYSETLRKNRDTLSCGCMRPYYNSLDKKKYNKYDLSGDYGIGYDKNGNEFYFDIEDYDKIKRFYWCVDENGYVVSTDKEREFAKVRMHRIVMNLYPGNSEILVDHIHAEAKNDNRKINLRIATGSQNCMNRGLMNTNTSGVTGVMFDENTGSWLASITKDYNMIRLGYYINFDDAVAARKAAEDIYFGDRSYNNSQAVIINK